MGYSECREVQEEAIETLRDASQCLIMSLQHVRSVSRHLPRRGVAPKPPTPNSFFFHDLQYDSLLSGEQVVDSSELLSRAVQDVCLVYEPVSNRVRGGQISKTHY